MIIVRDRCVGGTPEKRMTVWKTRYAMCAMLACIASARFALGQTVSVNYNWSQDFSQYPHLRLSGLHNTNQIQNSILAQQAKSDMASALQGKGLQQVQVSKPRPYRHWKQRHATADLL